MRTMILALALALGMVACGDEECCKVCDEGKACGDTCIASNLTCNADPGCACDK